MLRLYCEASCWKCFFLQPSALGNAQGQQAEGEEQDSFFSASKEQYGSQFWEALRKGHEHSLSQLGLLSQETTDWAA